MFSTRLGTQACDLLMYLVHQSPGPLTGLEWGELWFVELKIGLGNQAKIWRGLMVHFWHCS